LPRISNPSALVVSVIGRVTPFSSHPPQRFDQGLRLPFVLDLRLCRRWSSESPRTSHPSAVPINRPPGHPELRSLGIASDSRCELPRITNLPAPAGGLPSRPGSCTLRLCQRRISGSPRFSFPWHLQQVKFRVAPVLRSFWFRRRSRLSGCPDSQILLRCRRLDPQVAPHLCPSAIRLCFPGLPRFRNLRLGR